MRFFLILALVCGVILFIGNKQYEAAHTQYFACTAQLGNDQAAIKDCDTSVKWVQRVTFWETINNISIWVGGISLVIAMLMWLQGNPARKERLSTKNKLSMSDNEDVDIVFKNAVRIVVENGKASASLLQRHLRVGYAHAARLIEEMEERGIIGPANGSKARDVLVTSLDEVF